jgi:hypothetical protein
MRAFQAFVGALLETFRSRFDRNRYHPRLALRATRARERQ